MAKHIPVLLNEVLLHLFDPENDRTSTGMSPRRFWDGTFGRGGHTRAAMEKNPGLNVLGTDRDQAALDYGAENFASEIQSSRLKLKHFNFHHFNSLSDLDETEGFDAILLDLGVSSPQLDEPERGFSFYHDGPLDMRMDRSQDFSAADIVNTWGERELIELFREGGEIFSPQRVVKEIIKRRESKPFETTMELSLLIERTFGWRQKGKHPATNFFLALRLEVNQEITELHGALSRILEHGLKTKGRLSVITFHSTEDRIVKNLFKSSGHLGRNLTKKVIPPGREEILLNPRSRSAKLRVFQRE